MYILIFINKIKILYINTYHNTNIQILIWNTKYYSNINTIITVHIRIIISNTIIIVI